MRDEIAAFMETLSPGRRHGEALLLDVFFRETTGWQPQLHSGGMLGYGRYNYRYASGRSGTWFATGFAPRKAKISIYIMPGYADFDPILVRLGKYTKGKSCLYLNKLADADMSVLGELVRAGLDDLGTHWPVHPT